MIEFKKVSKSDFYEFIKNYPKKLEIDICGICEPPVVTYNDFTIADRWPGSVVARTFKYDNNKDGYYYEPEEKRIYCIRANML